MSRSLASWARSDPDRRGPRLTWPGDVASALRATVRRQVPGGAPPRSASARDWRPRAEISPRQLMRTIVRLRLDIEIVGVDALNGLDQPVVFAANEQGALDYQLLRRLLPARLRPTMARPSRALARGRNVVVFADEPGQGRLVGEFSTIPAELANQHNVAIVPVGIAGTFKLKRILKLALRTKPKVSVRFGAPIYLRGRSIADATAELQSRVEQLVHEGELSWWTIERRRSGSQAPSPLDTAARWRRLWEQSAPSPDPAPRIWR